MELTYKGLRDSEEERAIRSRGSHSPAALAPDFKVAVSRSEDEEERAKPWATRIPRLIHVRSKAPGYGRNTLSEWGRFRLG